MKVLDTPLTGVKILEPQLYKDSRGFFMESYSRKVFDDLLGEPIEFVQDNHSRSTKGVLRGLHYQVSPKEQGKLVRVVVGEILDVVVDIRRDSPTFGQWASTILSSTNNRQLWIPPGFAHGFYVLSDVADCLYKTTSYYSSEHERSILWCDKQLGIDWQLFAEPSISEKDRVAPVFDSANYV